MWSHGEVLQLGVNRLMSPIFFPFWFNQAKNLRDEATFSPRSAPDCPPRRRPFSAKHGASIYDFYASWYIGAIRALIDMHPFKDDYKALARQLFPPIKPKEAQKAVAILESLGMIRRKGDGYYAVVDKTITAGKEIVQLGLQNFQLQDHGPRKKGPAGASKK